MSKFAPVQEQMDLILRGTEEIIPVEELEQKLEKLSSQLEGENEPTKQQELIKSIDSLIDVIAKLKSN